MGPPLLALVAAMSLYCMFLILKCADKLARKHKQEDMGYGDVVELAFKVHRTDCLYVKPHLYYVYFFENNLHPSKSLIRLCSFQIRLHSIPDGNVRPKFEN